MAGLRPAALSPSEAVEVVEALAEVERLAAGAGLLLASRAAQAERGHGVDATAAGWLARVRGEAPGAASRLIEASERLGGLAEVTAAVRRGEVSATQAALVADGASADPRAQGRLLHTARHDSARELRQAVRRVKAAADADDDEARYARIHRERRCRHWTSADGAFEGTFRGPLHLGAEVAAALDAHRRQVVAEARARGDELPEPAALGFDALVRMARASVGQVEGAVARKVLVRADRDVLLRGQVGEGEVCDLPGFGPVPASVAASLAEDAVWHALLTKGTDVLAVTNAQRRPLQVQRTALDWQIDGCTVLGCGRDRYIEIDHRQPWSEVHTTATANLDPLCWKHHDLKTREGYRLEPGTGRRRMLSPAEQDQARSGGAAERGPPLGVG